MKKSIFRAASSIFFSVFCTLFLFSCGSGIKNFNKQKYTTLKSKEVKTDVNADIQSDPETETITYYEDEEETIYQETIGGQNEDCKINDAIVTNESTHQNEPELDTPSSSKTGAWEAKPQPEIQEVDHAVSTPPKIDEAALPFFIAWIVYVVAGFASIGIIFLGILTGLEIMLVIGFAMWPLLIILGALLLILVLRKKKETNNRLIKLIAIATMIELIIASVLTLFLILVLVIFFGEFDFFW